MEKERIPVSEARSKTQGARASRARRDAEVQTLLTSLIERRLLLEKLSRIQASISHRKPLQEVLDSITAGAVELLRDEMVGLRLVDPHDPEMMLVVSSAGVGAALLEKIRRSPADQGAGGLAMLRDELVVIENYEDSSHGVTALRADKIQSAMAAPVRENGRAIGSLVVASHRVDRRYSKSEKEVLTAFAEHASLALADAKMFEAMREAQRSRDMFLAMVSHELKTPLTVIMGTLRTLERHDKALDPHEKGRMLDAAIVRCRDLERLINRLLQGASAELADAEAEVSLPDLLADSIKGFGDTAKMTIAEIPPVSVYAYSTSVQRILGIFMENAVSHAPPGSEIRLGAEIDAGEVILWIENDGDLPVDDVDLFSAFQRGPDASSPGVGLGLYIAARVAAAINGSVGATVGEGAVRFCLTFPYRPAPAA
jgi:signal transduction histidine kinase